MRYLAELREVVLLAEGTLPQARGIIANGLVVTLSLWPPVSDARHDASDELSCRARRHDDHDEEG